MDIQLMPEQQQQKLVDLAKQVSSKVSTGMDPNEVMYKVAIEYDLPPDTINLLCRSVNVGHTLAFLKNAKDRTDEFPLADAAQIIKRVFSPEAEKTADSLDSCYRYPERLNYYKKLENSKPTPAVRQKVADKAWGEDGLNRAHHNIKSARQKVEHLKFDMLKAKKAFVDDIAKLTRYFRVYPEKFAEIDGVVPNTIGSFGSRIMNIVYNTDGLSRFVKRASAPAVNPQL